MIIWITKHALTEGIVEAEGLPSPRSTESVKVGEGYGAQYFHTPDWHADRGMAVMAAKSMQKVAVKKLEMELERVRGLVFE